MCDLQLEAHWLVSFAQWLEQESCYWLFGCTQHCSLQGAESLVPLFPCHSRGKSQIVHMLHERRCSSWKGEVKISLCSWSFPSPTAQAHGTAGRRTSLPKYPERSASLAASEHLGHGKRAGDRQQVSKFPSSLLSPLTVWHAKDLSLSPQPFPQKKQALCSCHLCPLLVTRAGKRPSTDGEKLSLGTVEASNSRADSWGPPCLLSHQ